MSFSFMLGQAQRTLTVLGALSLAVFLSQPTEAAPNTNKSKPGKAEKVKATKPIQPSEDFFTNSQMFRIQIEIPEEGIRTLRELRRWGGWGGAEQERPSVKATVREGETVYTNVAVHLKGAAGSFRAIDDHPSLTLNFDKYVKGQTFHGLQRFSLNNSIQDRSLLNEQIAREMFAKVGVPVPRATRARVELNGRDLGVEVLVEAANKQFLARHFKNPNGNLYDGGFLKEVDEGLKKSSGPAGNGEDLVRLAEAAREPDYPVRLAGLAQVLDLDQFISYLAVEVITCDWDGYAINKNNYRVYHDPDSDKIVFIPHGMDQMFGVMRARTDMPVFPRMLGLVARAVLQIPEGRQRYRDRLSQLVTNVFDPVAITNRVWELQSQLRPVLAERGERAARFQESAALDFCRRIMARWESLRQQLTAPDQSLKFDTAGLARFNDWKPRSDHGRAVLDEGTEGENKLLHISARNGSCVGVWFVKARLNPGRYRLEGKLKTQGVVVDPGDRKGGAGLRSTGQRFTQKLVGDHDWTNVAFDFEVQDSQPGDFFGPIQSAAPDVELICELRAAKGEAWFDRDSLRLIRR